MDYSNKDNLRSQQTPSPGKTSHASGNFAGHEARMQGHIDRIRAHTCEQTDGKKCPGCIKRKPL